MGKTPTIEQWAWRIVHEELPRWWNNYTSEYPRSKASERDLRAQGAHACVVATLNTVGAVPADVLAWITANPEAAKGLASGEMVAVPKEATLEMQHAYFDVIDANLRRVQTDCSFGRYSSNQQAYRAMIAAAPHPAPSAKAQGDDATEETPSWEVDRVLGRNIGGKP